MMVLPLRSLATAGYGTALGVVRCLHSDSALQQVYACETRPYNQGARLTAFEIVQDQLPGTLICDSMASACMRKFGCDAVKKSEQNILAFLFDLSHRHSTLFLFSFQSSLPHFSPLLRHAVVVVCITFLMCAYDPLLPIYAC